MAHSLRAPNSRSVMPSVFRFARFRGDWARQSILQRHPQAVWILLLAPAIIYLALFFFAPLVSILIQSFLSPNITFQHYARVLGNPVYLTVLLNTTRISAEVAILALILGFPVAFFLSQVSGRLAGYLLVFVLLPFWTSFLVRSYAWIVILRSEGIINSLLRSAGITSEPLALIYNEIGVVIAMVHIMLPYMILSLYGVMRRIDPTYIRAAGSLGASPMSTFLHIYLPMCLPGVVSGIILVFIFSIGFFIVPALLGGGKVPMIALQINVYINDLVNWGFASALSVVLLIFVSTLAFCFTSALLNTHANGIARRDGAALPDDHADQITADEGKIENSVELDRWARRVNFKRVSARPSGRAFDRPRRRYGWSTLQVFSFGVLIFLAVPVLLIIPMSFSTTPYLAFPPHGFTLRWYSEYFTDPSWVTSTVLSLKVAGIATGGAVILGTLAAVGLIRGSFPLRYSLFVGILAPLIVPVIVSAVAFYFLVAYLDLIGTLWAFSLAHIVLAIPVVVLVVSAALSRVDESMERAAMILGASGVRAFIAITLPLVRPSVVAAALFAFIMSFDEAVMVLFLAGTTNATLPAKMWDSIQFHLHPTVAAISTLLVALSSIVLITTNLLQNRDRRTSTGPIPD